MAIGLEVDRIRVSIIGLVIAHALISEPSVSREFWLHITHGV